MFIALKLTSFRILFDDYRGVYLRYDLKTVIDRCCVINNEANYHGHECKKSGQLIFRDINKSCFDNHGLPHPLSKSGCSICIPGGDIQ